MGGLESECVRTTDCRAAATFRWKWKERRQRGLTKKGKRGWPFLLRPAAKGANLHIKSGDGQVASGGGNARARSSRRRELNDALGAGPLRTARW